MRKLILLLSALPCFGQTAAPRFDVASIKRNNAVNDKAFLQPLPGGRLQIENVTPRTLVVMAFGVPAYQVSGGPSWAESDYYNLEAKAEGNPSVQEMEGPMLQALLADRFQLTYHRETKQVSAYQLKASNGGAKLKASEEGACLPYEVGAPPPPAPKPGEPRRSFCGYPSYALNGSKRSLTGRGIHMAELANFLSRFELFAPVVESTGLSGAYDINLEWTADAAPADGADTVSLFTVLVEQLGLKLERTKAPAEILVIDRMERPTPN